MSHLNPSDPADADSSSTDRVSAFIRNVGWAGCVEGDIESCESLAREQLLLMRIRPSYFVHLQALTTIGRNMSSITLTSTSSAF